MFIFLNKYTEKQQIFTIEKLKSEKVLNFLPENIKIVAD